MAVINCSRRSKVGLKVQWHVFIQRLVSRVTTATFGVGVKGRAVYAVRRVVISSPTNQNQLTVTTADKPKISAVNSLILLLMIIYIVR